MGPSERGTIKDLRDKIRSKMDTAKFLGTFITALVSFVLGERLDALKAAADPTQPIPIPPVQNWLWVVTVVLLVVAALSCFAGLFFYDGLLMPDRFWTSRARSRPPDVPSSLARYPGRQVHRTGDGSFATSDGPARHQRGRRAWAGRPGSVSTPGSGALYGSP